MTIRQDVNLYSDDGKIPFLGNYSFDYIKVRSGYTEFNITSYVDAYENNEFIFTLQNRSADVNPKLIMVTDKKPSFVSNVKNYTYDSASDELTMYGISSSQTVTCNFDETKNVYITHATVQITDYDWQGGTFETLNVTTTGSGTLNFTGEPKSIYYDKVNHLAKTTYWTYDLASNITTLTTTGLTSSHIININYLDRIKVANYSATATSLNVDEGVEIDVTLVYDYNDCPVTTGSFTVNTVSTTHRGDGVWRFEDVRGLPETVTYDTVAGSETTYGLSTVNQNSQSVTVVWETEGGGGGGGGGGPAPMVTPILTPTPLPTEIPAPTPPVITPPIEVDLRVVGVVAIIVIIGGAMGYKEIEKRAGKLARTQLYWEGQRKRRAKSGVKWSTRKASVKWKSKKSKSVKWKKKKALGQS